MYDVIQRDRLHNYDLSNSNLSYSTKLINYSGLEFGALAVIEKVHAKYCKLSFNVNCYGFLQTTLYGELENYFSYINIIRQQFVTSIATYHRMPLDDPVITKYYLSMWLKLGSSANYKMTEQTNRPIIRANRYMARPTKDVVCYTWLTLFSKAEMFYCLKDYSAPVSFLVRCVPTQ